jgi:outer membrane protein OmpA-like peptidoglycan-associated protein
MNIRISLLLPSLAFASLILAQDIPDSLNMIENGSFEQIEGKLKRLGSLEMAKGWKSPTAKKADLFSESVASAPASAPRSERGDQSALSGQNYAGLMWWSYMNKEPRTYVQAKFKKTLKKGQKYCVRYYVTLGDLSKYGADQFGAYLSKMLIKKDDESNLTYEPQIPALRTKIYDDLYSWQGVCGMYEAKGDEAYLVLGNFSANEKTNTVKIKRPKGETRPQAASAYYFIDDVAVFPIKSPSECKCEQLDKAESEFIYGKKTTTNKALKPDAQLDQSVIYFKRFQQTVDGSMDPLMNELTELLKANPDLKIRLIGHTDAIEAERVRMRPDLTELARERADAVKAAFVEGGIDAARIITADQKAESPADPNEGEVALSKNRRVEFELEK